MIRAALIFLVLAGCGPGTKPPPPGDAYIKITPAAPSLSDLTLTSASMLLENILLFGNVPPPPLRMPVNLKLDALGTTQQVKLPMPPQGIYSRVQFAFNMVAIDGTWKGTPFAVSFTPPLGFNPPVDLRSADGQEIGPGMDVTFAVALDVGSWFAGDLLDQAMASGGVITCDMAQNSSVTMQIVMRIHDSFSLP